MKQEDLVLDWCKKYKSITSEDASQCLGIGHLPKRISNLIAKGYKVIKITEKGINKHTLSPTHWTRYFVYERTNND